MGKPQIVIGSVSERLERERSELQRYVHAHHTHDLNLVFIQTFADGQTPIREVAERALSAETSSLYVGFVTRHMNARSIDAEECAFSYDRARALGIPVVLFLKKGAEHKGALDDVVQKAHADISGAVVIIPYTTSADLGPALTRYCFGENSGNPLEEYAVGI